MSENSFKRYCTGLVEKTREEPPNRTPSLLATVFGDVVEAHGGEIWLGSLIRLLAPLGINERLVRTSVYRLSQDGFLEGTKVGRRSFYRLSGSARVDVARYDRRIYYFHGRPWDSQWRLIFTGTQGISSPQRVELRRRLTWLGFGIIAPNVYGHPTASLEPVWSLFKEMGVTDKAVVMRAANFDTEHGLSTREMALQCFDLASLRGDYQAFISQFGPIANALAEDRAGDGKHPEHCFVLRTMLIHSYRRIVLRDPNLPDELLPETWPGHEAKHLCASIYREIEESSEQNIRAVCEHQSGGYREIVSEHRYRFRIRPVI